MNRKFALIGASLTLLAACTRTPSPSASVAPTTGDARQEQIQSLKKKGSPGEVTQRGKRGGQGKRGEVALNLDLPGWGEPDGHRHRAPYRAARAARPDELRAPIAAQAVPQAPIAVRAQAVGTVNVLYSDPLPASSPYRDGGRVHALQLANLLGHFGYQVNVKPISQFQSGDAAGSVRTFYIGTVFDEALPQAFLDETTAGAPVTWINYNVWKLGDKLSSNLGLQYLESVFASNGAEKTTFNRITYKSYTYDKYIAPMEMIKVAPVDSAVNVLATASDANGQSIPYIAKSGKFYFVADDPFTYMHPTDRYLAFADSLFAMLGSAEVCAPRAILRIEDLIADDDPSGLKIILDVLAQEKITKFGMTVIPQDIVPGANGTFSKYNWSSNVAMLNQVYRGINLGGRVIQHGYTHQYTPLLNPSGHSGDDWEFWYKAQETAIPNLTAAAAVQRIKDGRNLLLNLGIQQYAWTTPHYEAETSFYQPFNSVYASVIERRMYSGDGVRAGQFFPYPVRDVYGTRVIPENLGNIQVGWMPDKILEAAKANRNLSCPVASFFLHTYLFEADYTDADRTTPAQLAQLIRDIKALGYTFVDPLDVQVP